MQELSIFDLRIIQTAKNCKQKGISSVKLITVVFVHYSISFVVQLVLDEAQKNVSSSFNFSMVTSLLWLFISGLFIGLKMSLHPNYNAKGT